MKRLTAALLSLAWTAFFAAVAWSCMLAAEDGIDATAAHFGLATAPETLASLATRPVMAGLCLGASVVAALFATVLVSAILNTEENIGQGRFVADMAFGGGFGLAGVTAAGLLAHSSFLPTLVAVMAGGALLVTFFAMRAAMAEREVVVIGPRPVPARWVALDAAAHINVVRFPIERVAGARP